MPISINHHRRRRRHHHHHDNHHPNSTPPKENPNPRKFLLFFLKCIVMACILPLFLLFLGFAALILLHFLFITTAFRHRRSSATTTVLNHLNDTLPEIIYSASSAQPTKDCAICLELLKEGESCRSLPACGHLFHMICVDSWLTKVPNCPICRTRVLFGSQESDSMMSDDDWKIWWTVGG